MAVSGYEGVSVSSGGSFVSLSPEGEGEFVGFSWESAVAFDVFENVVSPSISDVEELVVVGGVTGAGSGGGGAGLWTSNRSRPSWRRLPARSHPLAGLRQRPRPTGMRWCCAQHRASSRCAQPFSFSPAPRP